MTVYKKSRKIGWRGELLSYNHHHLQVGSQEAQQRVTRGQRELSGTKGLLN